MYFKDKISILTDLNEISSTSHQQQTQITSLSDPEFQRLIKEVREFLIVSQQIERKIRDHDDRQQHMMQQFSQKQWTLMSQEFDNKMTSLMADNERRLKDILRLQEDRYSHILA
jgi:hypothetical protein